MLSGWQVIEDQLNIREGRSPNAFGAQSSTLKEFESARPRPLHSATDDLTTLREVNSTLIRWTTLFDALHTAQGVTTDSDLAAVKVVHKQPMSHGVEKARAQMDFNALTTEGDKSVSIRLFDGDVVKVGLSDELLRDQLLAASRTNLSPDSSKSS